MPPTNVTAYSIQEAPTGMLRSIYTWSEVFSSDPAQKQVECFHPKWEGFGDLSKLSGGVWRCPLT